MSLSRRRRRREAIAFNMDSNVPSASLMPPVVAILAPPPEITEYVNIKQAEHKGSFTLL